MQLIEESLNLAKALHNCCKPSTVLWRCSQSLCDVSEKRFLPRATRKVKVSFIRFQNKVEYSSAYLQMHTYAYTYIYICTYIEGETSNIYISIHMHIYRCICTYIYICMYIYIVPPSSKTTIQLVLRARDARVSRTRRVQIPYQSYRD